MTTLTFNNFIKPLKSDLDENIVQHARISENAIIDIINPCTCLLYTSPSPRDATLSRMPSSA